MATNLSEGGKIKCIQYWPDKGSKKYGSISVTLVKSEQFPDYFLRTINVKQENSDQEHEVKQFHFTVWPDMGVPNICYWCTCCIATY
uniref:protein-tyrosine-phosphatase n=1 Tax=Saccoglossus kowalevskii TaxID=10224 RepID=A0ABM0M0L6_SACKO|nr:PREDICTED: receptor-type tyrosine-protein phosphatase U-like [Saccoglossus kowalevskii]